MIIAEPSLGVVQPLNVLSDDRTPSRDKPKLIPKDLDLLPPFVKIGRALAFLGTCHRLASEAVCDLDARGERAKLSMSRPPSFGALSKLAEVPIDRLPRPVLLGGDHQGMFVGRQVASNPGESTAIEQLWIPFAETRECFQHRDRVPEFRERVVDLAQPFLAVCQSAPAVGFDQLDDGADLLDALTCFMDRPVGRRVGPPQDMLR